MSSFVNVHNHTEYSLLDGMINIDELLNFAEKHNQPAIGMTDHGVMGGFREIIEKSQDRNVKPLIGVELYLVKDINFQENRGKGEKEFRYHFLSIAKNREGLKNLFKLTTESHKKGFYYKPRVDMEMIKKYKDNLIFSSACSSGVLSKMLLENKMEKAKKQAKKFKNIFEDFYIEIMPHTFEEQKYVNPRLIEIAQENDIPLIATSDAHYLEEEAESHKIQLAIGSGGGIWEFSGDKTYYLMTKGEILEHFTEHHPEISSKHIHNALANTEKLAEKVEKIEPRTKRKIIPKPYPELETDEQELEKLKELIEKGWEERNALDKKEDPEYQERLERELETIQELDFVRYFLVWYDLYNNFIKPAGIMYGTGRGSSASSLVSYLLGITNPDPIKYDLMFSRFINPDRVTMPDIDADFEDRRREEIKDYLRKKYGDKKTADIGTYGHMKGKQVLRDVSRVFDIPKYEVDPVSNQIIQRSSGDARRSQTIEDSFSEFQECKEFNEKYPQVLKHAKNLEGRIRQNGVHAAGVICSPFNITDAMPLELRGGQGGKMVTALEGEEVERMGFMKLDVLGLKTLSIIQDTIDQVGLERQDLVNLDYDDEKVLGKFNEGDTEGVFQFNSQGMSDTLESAPITEFQDLVAMNSLYRPGGMRSGIARDYINRMKGEEIESVHPIFDDITKDTNGLMIYQEQIMQVFDRMAGFPAVEVDLMRKKVAKSHGEEAMDDKKEDFINGCLENDVDRELAEDLWGKIVHFGSYAFNKSHAVVYTQIAYWTQWLKVYYPLEFYVSSLNNENDDDKVKKLLSDLEDKGYELLMPHINKSGKKFKVEEDDSEKKVRCGLKYIKGIGDKTADEIVEHQPYEDEEDITENDDIDHRTFHKGIIRKLNEVKAWKDDWSQEEKEETRGELASEELYPFPVLDKSIGKAIELANHYDADFTKVEDLTTGQENNVSYVRGVFNGIDYNKIGDFEDAEQSKWDAGTRYAVMDLIDETGHVRVKFPPDKYQQFKDDLQIGNKVLINAQVYETSHSIFANYMVVLNEENVEKHKEKYGDK